MKHTENTFLLMSLHRIDFGRGRGVLLDTRGCWLQNPGKQFREPSEETLRVHSLLSCSREAAVTQSTAH